VAIQNGSHSGRQARAPGDFRPQYASVRAVRSSELVKAMRHCTARG
jgi:hypothetical protein